ncbi:MAG: hypothetical protein Q7S84_01760 [bacterium]|nr:hypothetical protein [bacterium]
MRTGYEFCPGSTPPNPCNETGDSVSFTNYAGRPTTIEWRPGGGGTTGGIYRTNSSVTYRLTGEDVDITAARFAVTQTVGATASACFPWRVTIALTARPRDPALADRTVVLQTTVTARTLPVEVPTAGQWVLDNCQLDD